MNINLKQVEIEGTTFQLSTMPSLKACVLDRKILAIILPSLGSVAEKGLNTEISVGTLINNLSDGLLKLNDLEFKNLILNMFAEVTAISNTDGALSLDNEININKIFNKKVMNIYKLLIEVMKYNGFSVFGVGDGGLGIDKIFTSTFTSDTTKNAGIK